MRFRIKNQSRVLISSFKSQGWRFYLGSQAHQSISGSIHEDEPAPGRATPFPRVVLHAKNESPMLVEDGEPISPLETHARSLPYCELGRTLIRMSAAAVSRCTLAFILSRMNSRHRDTTPFKEDRRRLKIQLKVDGAKELSETRTEFEGLFIS